MGGKQGAHALNQFIFAHLRDLLTNFNVIHQTGINSVTQDYSQSLALQNTLGSLGDCYMSMGYISEAEIGTYLHSADLYLGRSGAHITYELGVVGLPAILVPLMSTHDHEQHKNAGILVKAKLGVIVPQSELSYPNFIQSISDLKQQKPRPLGLAKDATDRLVKSFISELD
jgi:UDP-N-acetylglucosamine--N-acetylmuramyl-(pentapeptide) pyrophosphoryl-undecaprenol N-acetylglucosamine transferase